MRNAKIRWAGTARHGGTGRIVMIVSTLIPGTGPPLWTDTSFHSISKFNSSLLLLGGHAIDQLRRESIAVLGIFRTCMDICGFAQSRPCNILALKAARNRLAEINAFFSSEGSEPLQNSFSSFGGVDTNMLALQASNSSELRWNMINKTIK